MNLRGSSRRRGTCCIRGSSLSNPLEATTFGLRLETGPVSCEQCLHSPSPPPPCLRTTAFPFLSVPFLADHTQEVVAPNWIRVRLTFALGRTEALGGSPALAPYGDIHTCFNRFVFSRRLGAFSVQNEDECQACILRERRIDPKLDWRRESRGKLQALRA